MSLTKFGKKMLGFIALVALVFILFSCDNNTNSDKAEKKAAAEKNASAIFEQLLWDDSAMKDITNNLTLVTKTRFADTTVTWASDHPDIINPETGKVTVPTPEHEDAILVDQSKPEGSKHVKVKLTATISTEYTYTENDKEKTGTVTKKKEFDFTVLCVAEIPAVTIADAKAAAYQYIYEEKGVEKGLVSNSSVVYKTTVYGVVTAKLNAEGAGQFMIHDGTAGIYVYNNKVDVKLGDTVRVTGNIYSYYGSLQIGSEIIVEVVNDRGIVVPAHTEISVDTWEKTWNENLPVGYLGGNLYKIYAKLEEGSNGKTSDEFKLVDPTTGEVAWIYYKSYNPDQKEILKSYVGKYVNITGVTYDRDSRLLKNHLLWDGGIEEAEAPSLDDETKANLVKTLVENLAGDYAAGSALVLPTANQEYGATITWNIPAEAPYKDGKFSIVDVDTPFTATAEVKVGEATVTATVKFTVKKLNKVAVEDAVKLEKGSAVKLAGTVEVVFSSYNNYYLKDNTGAILVYVKAKDGIKVNGETKTLKPGDKVEFIGIVGYFNGTPQITEIVSYTSYEEGTWKIDAPKEVTFAEIKAFTAANAPYGQYLMIRGVVASDGNYVVLKESTASDAITISLYYSTIPDKVAAVKDTDTEVTIFAYYYGNSKADYTGAIRVIFAGRDGEYFVGDETVIIPEPNTKVIVTDPEVGVAYNLMVVQKNLEGKELYFSGSMSGNFLATSENDYEAAKVYLEACEGGFHFYYLEGETKKYIEVFINDSGKNQIRVVETATTVWTFDADLQTLVTTIDGTAYYLGTYKTFATFSSSKTSYAATSFVGHLYKASKAVAPDPDPKPEIKTDFPVKSFEELGNLVPEDGNTTDEKYYVAGYVKSIENPTYGNMTLEDKDGNTFIIYGLYDVTGKVRYDEMKSDKPVVGDIVVIYGILTNFKGDAEIKNGWLVQLGEKVLDAGTDPDPDPRPEITTKFPVKSFLEVKGLIPEAGNETTEKHYVAGYVKEIQNETYGNLLLEDKDGNTILVYGLYDVNGEVRYDAMTSDKPVVDSIVVVYGALKNYNGTLEVVDACLYQLGEKVFTPKQAASNEAVFEWVKGNGTIEDKVLTVVCEGYTITLAQAGSGNAVVNSYGELRMYQKAILTITATNGKKIKSITFADSKGSKSITLTDANLSYELSGGTYTITAKDAANSIGFTLDSQIRTKKITIVFED